MKSLFLLVTVIILNFIFIGCKENPEGPEIPKIAEGSWHGTLNSSNMFATFLEGRFENSTTLTGSVTISSGSDSITYLVMNGGSDNINKIWFALYKDPPVNKEEFHLEGLIVHDTLRGNYKQFNENSEVIAEGNWSIVRTP